MVPGIRFNEFEDEWQKNTLGGVSEIHGGGTPSTSNPKYWNGDINWYTPAEINSQNFVYESQKKITELGLKKSSAKILPIGTILFTSRAGIGKTAILAREGTTNQGIQSIVPNENKLDSYFLYSRTNELRRYGEEKGAGSTFVEVSGKQMSKMPINIPSLKEQEITGFYFKQLDELISTQNIEINQLNNFKQAMLQKMFPKEGETVPEVRFEGFEEDWADYKLGDIADIIGGGTPSTLNPTYWNGAIDWYTPAEIGDKTYVNCSQKKITKLGLESSSAKILPVGTVVFTSRAGIGKTAILAKEGATNQGFQSIIPYKNLLDSYFIYSKTNELKRYGENKGAGSTFVEVSGKQMGKMPLLIPTINEQKRIGGYFQTLDNNIQAKQAELNKLKQFKQAMLDKMFV